MSEKKMVSRNVVIALGIICIVLIALIVYFTVIGISAQNSYNNLQNQNKQLQTWLDGNETLLNQTQADNTNLQNQNANLTNQVNNLTGIANLWESEIWLQTSNGYTELAIKAGSSASYTFNNTIWRFWYGVPSIAMPNSPVPNLLLSLGNDTPHPGGSIIAWYAIKGETYHEGDFEIKVLEVQPAYIVIFVKAVS